MMRPASSGRTLRPEARALSPATVWNQRGRKMIRVKNPKAARNIAATEIENVRRRNRPSGTIGSATRDSIHRNRAPKHEAHEDQPADAGIRPLPARLVGQADEERRDREREHDRADVVDMACGVRDLDRRQEAEQDDERDEADRDVDEEDPVPADRVGDDAADERPDERRQPEHGAEEAEVLAALGRRVEVRDDRERDREDGAAAEALEPAEQDELPHLLAEARQGRADEEQAHGEDDDRAATEQVGQLAVDRAADRGRQQVDRDGPGVEVVAMQVGDDPGERRPDHGLVEGEQEQREQDRAEDLELRPRRQVERGIVRGRRVRHRSSGGARRWRWAVAIALGRCVGPGLVREVNPPRRRGAASTPVRTWLAPSAGRRFRDNPGVNETTGTVAWIAIAPVKAMALVQLERAVLERTGIRGDRAFAVIDAQARRVGGKRIGPLALIRPDHDPESGRLALRFPDGVVVDGVVELDGPIDAMFSNVRSVRPVIGPWSAAISAWAGQALRLVALTDPGNGLDRGPSATLLSTAALASLAEAGGEDRPLDGRRFRMTFGIDGVEAYAEDDWVGREVRVGGAVVRPVGNVGRCAVTTQDPDTGPTVVRHAPLPPADPRLDGNERAPSVRRVGGGPGGRARSRWAIRSGRSSPALRPGRTQAGAAVASSSSFVTVFQLRVVIPTPRRLSVRTATSFDSRKPFLYHA